MLAIYALSTAFVVPTPLATAPHMQRAVAPLMVDIPRVALPDAIADVIKEQDLNSPNDLSDGDYNTYSAAAIGGTLIFFLLPIFNLLGPIGDFVFSALIGGGVGAYASLRKDTVGEYGNKFGGYVLMAVDKVVEQTPAVKAKVEELIDSVKKQI